MKFKPFKGFRPLPDRTGDVVSPPYDVINTAEARELAQGKPDSFLYVVRPEIGLDEGVSLYDDSVYAAARSSLTRLMESGVLQQDTEAGYYFYQQIWGRHVQTGIVGAASVSDYDEGRIKKHEHTRQQKEDDRARHVDTTSANTGPVFLTYRAEESIDEVVREEIQDIPDIEVSQAGVLHRLWVIQDAEKVALLETAFSEVDSFYVADGHHRSASGSRVREARQGRNPNHTGEEDYNRFLAVVFPDSQLQILAYNRLVKDLNGLETTEFLNQLQDSGLQVEKTSEKEPTESGSFGMYLAGEWYAVSVSPDSIPDDPVSSLDVALLQDQVLAPLLGLGDPRTDDRIAFAGGIRGTQYLEQQVDEGHHAVAFSMVPTRIDQLLDVADSGKVMPPKSTWFEPKLLSGLVVHQLDGPELPA